MNTQVLSIEQMQELIELGIDTSKASMYYSGGSSSIIKLLPKTGHGKLHPCSIPTFTLQDILEMLPNYVIVYAGEIDNEYKISVALGEPNKYHIERSLNGLLQTAFNLLKWCKKNSYI